MEGILTLIVNVLFKSGCATVILTQYGNILGRKLQNTGRPTSSYGTNMSLNTYIYGKDWSQHTASQKILPLLGYRLGPWDSMPWLKTKLQ